LQAFAALSLAGARAVTLSVGQFGASIPIDHFVRQTGATAADIVAGQSVQPQQRPPPAIRRCGRW
jgi:hypothetical protein